MPSEIFDCCHQQSLMPTIVRRRHLLHTRCLPTQTDVREKLGKDLADVVFDRMNPIEKCLMGLDKPLNGPTEQMWVNPRDKVRNNIRLTPIPTDDHIRALTHQGVLEIGGILEQRRDTHEKYKIETAVREAVEFEQFEGKLRMRFELRKERQKHEKALKMLELKLLEQQRDREDCLMKVFEKEKDSLVKCLQETNEQKIREAVTSAVQKTRERLINVYERRYCEAFLERIETLKQELKEECEAKGLVNISDAKDQLKNEVTHELRSETKRQLESLEVKHVAEVLHIVCAERTAANDKLEEQKMCQKTTNDIKFTKIMSLLDQLYHFCPEKFAEFCLAFEELQEELTVHYQTVAEDNFDQSDTISSCLSIDSSPNRVLDINSTSCFPSSVNWITQSSSETDTSLDNCSVSLVMDLTPQVLMKAIIKHIRRNPKYMQEALKNGEEWEKHAIKTSLEKIMSFFLNGQNLTMCINEILESLSHDGESCYSKELEEAFVRYTGDKLISTKDSFELIPLPHIPEIPPVTTSKLIQARDSLEVFSHRSKTISESSVTSSDSVPVPKTKFAKTKRDTTSYLDFKPKAPKYFSLNLHCNKRSPVKIPYKECTDEDIDQLFSEYEASHPSLLKKHRPKPEVNVCKEQTSEKSITDPSVSLRDEHYAKKLAALPIRDVLDIITTD